MTASPRPIVPASPSSRRRLAGMMLAALPAVLLVGVLGRAATNAPATDDYISLLPFLCDWVSHTTFAEHWTLLTAQFIGHRIIFTRLATLLDFHLFGEFNLVALQVAGWIGWLLLAGGLAATNPSVRRAPWMALPVTLLLMHPEGYSNTLAAIGMGNLWVVAFAFFSLACAFSLRRGTFALALVLAVLAASAFANGLMVFPAAALSLAVLNRWKHSAIFAGAGLVVWSLYLHGYQSSMGAFSLPELFRKAAIMAGGPIILSRMPEAASLFAGALLLGLAASLLCFRRFWREMPVHASFLVFVGLTIFMAARGRSGWADYYMLQDRYRLYGLLILAVGYLAWIELFPSRQGRLAVIGVGLGGTYCLLAYASFLSPMLTAQRLYAGTALNAQIGECFPCSIPKDWPVACASLERSASLGVYHLPKYLSPADLAVIQSLRTNQPPATELFHLEQNDAIQGHFVMPSDWVPGLQPPELAVLVAPDHMVLLPVDVFRPRLAEIIPRFSLLGGHFGLRLPSPVYQAGRQAVYGLTRGSDGKLAVIFASALTLR